MSSIWAFASGLGLITWIGILIRGLQSRNWLYRAEFSENPPRSGPGISIIVPARNEEENLPECLPTLLEQNYSPFEVIVVNDRSDDDTEAILATIDHPRLTVIQGEEPPDNSWLGKPWACQQGIDAAQFDWLLFTDADMTFEPDLLAGVAEKATDNKNQLFSLLPSGDCPGWFNKFVLPWHGLMIFLLFPLHHINRNNHQTALAAGGFIFMHRELYNRIGGHKSIRDRIAEDLALAQQVKQFDGSITLLSTSKLQSQMYSTFKGMITGIAKHLLAAPLPPTIYLPTGLIIFFLGTLFPLVGLLFNPLNSPAGYMTVGYLGIIHLLAAGMYKELKASPLWILSAIPALIIYQATCIYAFYQQLRHGGPVWKNRRVRQVK